MAHRYFSQLSVPRQVLVRLCQATNYGYIRNLELKNADPIFTPMPVAIVDEKLDTDERRREELELTDFVLPAEVCRLMDRLDELKNGNIEQIEVRAGIPRRIVYERRLTEAPH